MDLSYPGSDLFYWLMKSRKQWLFCILLYERGILYKTSRGATRRGMLTIILPCWGTSAFALRDCWRSNLVPRVSHLTALWGGKMRDPGNEVVDGVVDGQFWWAFVVLPRSSKAQQSWWCLDSHWWKGILVCSSYTITKIIDIEWLATMHSMHGMSNLSERS